MKQILIVIDQDSESNSGYHVANVALQLLEHNLSVFVHFSQISKGITFDVLKNSEVTVGTIGQEVKNLDFLYIWSPRTKQRVVVESQPHRYLITHIEDNEFYLAESRGNPSEVSEIQRVIQESDLVTFINSNTKDLIPETKKSYLLMPGIDDITHRENAAPTGNNIIGQYFFYAGNVTNFVIGGLTNIGMAISKLNEILGTKYFLFVSGKDYTKQLTLRIPDTVLVGNFLEKHHVSTLMRHAIANVQCASNSRFDRYRFPSKLPEYLVSGRPLMTELFELDIPLYDYKNCLIVKNSSVESWLDCLIALMKLEPEDLAEITLGAADLAMKNLSWKRSVSGLVTALGEL
jgi:hypothetical protein